MQPVTEPVHSLGNEGSQPIRLPPTHRLAGVVALDELLGVGIAGRYEPK